ncbi:triple QxxK/R motif-containing protein-like [Centruroides vittatus]|uniref:triple QxxK/R motif-containing protein-like n=1 Tax=Centruroides vittatus TaxID=120091 RepID=UPI00350F07BF
MGRSRKDSFNQLPVDQYRKQIGKQDSRKSKSSLKESRDKALIKKGFGETYKEISLMLTALVTMTISVYLLFYLYLAKSPEPEEIKMPRRE